MLKNLSNIREKQLIRDIQIIVINPKAISTEVCEKAENTVKQLEPVYNGLLKEKSL